MRRRFTRCGCSSTSKGGFAESPDPALRCISARCGVQGVRLAARIARLGSGL